LLISFPFLCPLYALERRVRKKKVLENKNKTKNKNKPTKQKQKQKIYIYISGFFVLQSRNSKRAGLKH
jgi:hypothetical protein